MPIKKTSYRWLMSQSKIAKPFIYLTVFLGLISGICIIIQAWLLAHIITAVYLHHAVLSQLKPTIIFLLLIICLRPIMVWLREITAYKSAQTIKQQVRNRLFNDLLAQTPHQMNKQKTGALTTTLIEKVDALHGFFADYLPQMTLVLLLPLIILILVFQQNWLAGTVLLVTAPLIPLFMALVGMGAESLNQRQFKSLSRLSAYFLDLLQGINTLTLFNQARAQYQQIKKLSDAYRIKTMQVLRIAFLSSAVLELFSTIAIAIIAVYLGLGLLRLVHIGFGQTPITLTSAFFILLLAPEFFMPLRQLGTFYHARAEAIAAANDLISLEKNSIHTHIYSHSPLLSGPLDIQINNITFAYPNKKPIFNQFTARIPEHTCTVISGPSGIGKSTLLQLIAGLQTPQSGLIAINHINLTEIDPNDWRKHFTLLQQSPYLFHDTIARNIALSKPNATHSDIQQAATLAGITAFTNTLPDGLNTLIGEQYLGLSGGQAQRVALARAYLKASPIILLDEPTAHLDQENKQYLMDALTHWKGKKTLIIATHDPLFTSLADQTIVLG